VGGDGHEGAKFWLQVLTELKNRTAMVTCMTSLNTVQRWLNGQSSRRESVGRLTALAGSGAHP
jgi:transposase-like protein